MAHATPEKVVPKSTPMTILLATEDAILWSDSSVLENLLWRLVRGVAMLCTLRRTRPAGRQKYQRAVYLQGKLWTQPCSFTEMREMSPEKTACCTNFLWCNPPEDCNPWMDYNSGTRKCSFCDRMKGTRNIQVHLARTWTMEFERSLC